MSWVLLFCDSICSIAPGSYPIRMAPLRRGAVHRAHAAKRWFRQAGLKPPAPGGAKAHPPINLKNSFTFTNELVVIDAARHLAVNRHGYRDRSQHEPPNNLSAVPRHVFFLLGASKRFLRPARTESAQQGDVTHAARTHLEQGANEDRTPVRRGGAAQL